MLKIKVWIYRRLETFFLTIESLADSAAQYFSICSDCGRNRYTGEPCK